MRSEGLGHIVGARKQHMTRGTRGVVRLVVVRRVCRSSPTCGVRARGGGGGWIVGPRREGGGVG
jgi:hypothetical protein